MWNFIHQDTYPIPVDVGQTRVTYINGLPCDVNITNTPLDELSLPIVSLKQFDSRVSIMNKKFYLN